MLIFFVVCKHNLVAFSHFAHENVMKFGALLFVGVYEEIFVVICSPHLFGSVL